MKRSILRASMATLAAIAPAATIMSVAPSALAAPVTVADQAQGVTPATVELGGKEGVVTPNQPAEKTKWRSTLARFTEAGYAVKEISSYSPSMNRHVPLVLIQPLDEAKRNNAPTVYLLNGADGGEGTANWIAQTDIIQYYGGNTNPNNGVISPGIGANIVIPMSGAFSYYTDWVGDNPGLQGGGNRQNWETFMTKELPAGLEPLLGANGKRAIAGMSMTGTTSLLYAEHNPGFYDAVGSFSGCAATTTGVAPAFIDITLGRGGANMGQMWGGPTSETARYNDALLNADKLRGQENIYVSNGSGLAGPHDLPSSPRVNGNLSASGTVIVEGGVIEAATNTCTHDLRAKTDALGIPVTYNFRPVGTHQWGYWEDDLRDFWPVLVNGLGTGAQRPAEPNRAPNTLNGNGSANLSALPSVKL